MADYFATYEEVRKIGNLPKVEQAVIEAFFPDAKREVVDRISPETYAEKFALTEANEDYINIRSAEVRLVLYYLIPAINISSSGDGVTKARGFGDSRKENLSEADIDTIIQRHKDQAEKLLKPFAKTVDKDEDESPDILVTPGLSFASLDSDADID